MRSAIVAHMFVIESYIRSHGFESTEQYLQATRMNKPGVWATDIKIYILVHLLNTPIVVYVTVPEKRVLVAQIMIFRYRRFSATTPKNNSRDKTFVFVKTAT